MANITIPNLPAATSLNGDEQLETVQSGTSRRITTGQIVSLATGGGGVLPLPVVAGGTGNTTFDVYGVLYGDGTNPIEAITPPTGSNYILVASPNTIPAWQENIPVTAGVNSISFGSTGLTPNTATEGIITVAGTLDAANGGTGATTFTANGVIYGNTASPLGVTAAGTTGQVLIATTSGAPSWGAVPSAAAVTSITFGTTGLTPSTATTGAVTVAGTLVAANGGTGVNNGSSTLTMAGNVTYAGVFTQTFTATGNTSVTLPTSGTLVNTAVTTLSSLSSIGTVTVGTWNATAIDPVYGGTGLTSYTTGDILYASGANTLAKLPVGTNGSPLTLAAGIPSWAGTIGVAFGGTGATTIAAAQTNLQVDPAGTAVAMAIALG